MSLSERLKPSNNPSCLRATGGGVSHINMLSASQAACTSLYISYNSISSLKNIEQFQQLTVLLMEYNALNDVTDLLPLAKLKKLRVLRLEGNPLCKIPLWEIHALKVCPKLKEINGVDTSQLYGGRYSRDELNHFLEVELMMFQFIITAKYAKRVLKQKVSRPKLQMQVACKIVQSSMFRDPNASIIEGDKLRRQSLGATPEGYFAFLRQTAIQIHESIITLGSKAKLDSSFITNHKLLTKQLSSCNDYDAFLELLQTIHDSSLQMIGLGNNQPNYFQTLIEQYQQAKILQSHTNVSESVSNLPPEDKSFLGIGANPIQPIEAYQPSNHEVSKSKTDEDVNTEQDHENEEDLLQSQDSNALQSYPENNNNGSLLADAGILTNEQSDKEKNEQDEKVKLKQEAQFYDQQNDLIEGVNEEELLINQDNEEDSFIKHENEELSIDVNEEESLLDHTHDELSSHDDKDELFIHEEEEEESLLKSFDNDEKDLEIKVEINKEDMNQNEEEVHEQEEGNHNTTDINEHIDLDMNNDPMSSDSSLQDNQHRKEKTENAYNNDDEYNMNEMEEEILQNEEEEILIIEEEEDFQQEEEEIQQKEEEEHNDQMEKKTVNEEEEDLQLNEEIIIISEEEEEEEDINFDDNKNSSDKVDDKIQNKNHIHFLEEEDLHEELLFENEEDDDQERVNQSTSRNSIILDQIVAKPISHGILHSSSDHSYAQSTDDSGDIQDNHEDLQQIEGNRNFKELQDTTSEEMMEINNQTKNHHFNRITPHLIPNDDKANQEFATSEDNHETLPPTEPASSEPQRKKNVVFEPLPLSQLNTDEIDFDASRGESELSERTKTEPDPVDDTSSSDFDKYKEPQKKPDKVTFKPLPIIKQSSNIDSGENGSDEGKDDSCSSDVKGFVPVSILKPPKKPIVHYIQPSHETIAWVFNTWKAKFRMTQPDILTQSKVTMRQMKSELVKLNSMLQSLRVKKQRANDVNERGNKIRQLSMKHELTLKIDRQRDINKTLRQRLDQMSKEAVSAQSMNDTAFEMSMNHSIRQSYRYSKQGGRR